MKTIIIIFSLLTLLVNITTSAEDYKHKHEGILVEKTFPGISDTACEDTINVKVNGLVCDFCARALEKVFGKRHEVSGINVDLDKGSVIVAIKPGMNIDEKIIKQLITDSGYNVTTIDKGC